MKSGQCGQTVTTLPSRLLSSITSPRLFAFQFDQDQIHPLVAGVLRQMHPRRGKYSLACLEGPAVLLPVGRGELDGGVVEGYGNRVGMAVHDRLLVRAVVDLEDPHLIVLTHHRVMLGIDFGSILR